MIDWLEKHMLPCAYKSIFGIDCPGCGFQRSCIALLRGDLVKSIWLYPATIPLFIVAGYAIFDLYFHFDRKNIIKRRMMIGIGALILSTYILKLAGILHPVS